MTLVYRAVPDDDEYRSVYRHLLRYAFAPERGPDPDDDTPEQPPEFEPRGLYAVADGAVEASAGAGTGRSPPDATDVAPDDLVVAGALLDFRMRIRGAFRPVGGVTAIASPPEHRRGGRVGTLLDQMHCELRSRDVAFAALWPFSHSFYRRFDYGRTNDYLSHEFPPDALDTPTATPLEEGGGAFRRLSADDPDDVEALVGLHDRCVPEPLALARSPDWWRLRVFRTWTSERFVYGWGGEELRASLAYTFEEGDDGRTLVVAFWDAADDEAYRQLLAFLRNHDSQVSRIRLYAGDASLLDRLADPAEEVTSTVKPGPMLRIVDVEAALTGLETPVEDERVVLSVSDPRYEWNDGRFELRANDGVTTYRAVDSLGDVVGGAVDEENTDLVVDVGALSRVVVGARSATDLAALGDVEADADALARLDVLLPVERPAPYLREWF
jgi:predicted acetyltransferase